MGRRSRETREAKVTTRERIERLQGHLGHSAEYTDLLISVWSRDLAAALALIEAWEKEWKIASLGTDYYEVQRCKKALALLDAESK